MSSTILDLALNAMAAKLTMVGYTVVIPDPSDENYEKDVKTLMLQYLACVCPDGVSQ